MPVVLNKQTTITANKTVSLKGLVPPELVVKLKEANAQAERAKEAIVSVVRGTAVYAKLEGFNGSKVLVTEAYAVFQHSVQVDGVWQERPDPAPRHNYMDHTTMNLLLNSKIITNEQKYALLVDKGLLPAREEGNE